MTLAIIVLAVAALLVLLGLALVLPAARSAERRRQALLLEQLQSEARLQQLTHAALLAMRRVARDSNLGQR